MRFSMKKGQFDFFRTREISIIVFKLKISIFNSNNYEVRSCSFDKYDQTIGIFDKYVRFSLKTTIFTNKNFIWNSRTQ